MNLHFKKAMYLLFFLGIILKINAQEKVIKGLVSDNTGPLPGVNVIVKETAKGVETDFDGKYSIKVKVGDVLVFSFVGMKTVEKTVGSSNNMNIIMQGDELLEEVVVVGYGTATKESFTGTAKVVDSRNIDAKSVSNVAQALAGEASGVSVIRTNNRPGASADIRIRGFSSIQGNRSPLYVVDGVPFSGGVNSINPNDIASTTILKDASATAIYGSRGANGVIVITTKSGKSGKSYIEFDSKVTVNTRSLPNYQLVDNQEDYIGLVYNGLKNSAELDATIVDPTQTALDQIFDGTNGIAPLYNMWNVANGSELIDVTTGKVKKGVTRKFTPNKWADLGYRTGIRQEMNFKIAGGSEKTKHFFSLGYLDDEGYINNSQYDRYSARLNLSTKATNWLKASTNLSYSHSINNDATGYGGGVVTYMLDYTPSIYSVFLRDEDGNIVNNENLNAPFYDFGDNTAGNARNFSATYNGIGEAIYNINRTKTNSVNANISLVADLFKGLTLETTYGVNMYDSNLGRTRNSLQGSSGVAPGGTLFIRNTNYMAQNFNQILRYRTEFEDKHSIEALVAHETNEDSFTFNDLSKKGIVNLNPEAALTPDNYIDQNGNSGGFTRKSKLESYFGQVNYDFDNKYYLSTTLRRDGSSRFLNNKWGTFWSVGAGWIISKEGFLNSSDILNYLKFKVSYGVLGDQGGVNTRVNTFTDEENYVGADYYGGQGGFDIQNLLGAPSLIPRPIVDSNITWETSNQFQTGLEFELFNGRIEASVDYYRKETGNLFVDKRLAPSTGDAVIRTNDGALLNQGFEFDITGHIFKKEDFKLSLAINGEIFDNEMLQMPIDNSTGELKVINISGYYAQAKGKSIYDYYLREWAGVNKDNGDPQWIEHWVDTNNNDTYDTGEGIDDLAVYTSENPNQTIKERLTNNYANATRKFSKKSVIPSIRGAFRLNTSYKDFSLSTQIGYSLGGYGYDQMYANLMSNGQVGGANYHTDIKNSWKKTGDITDVPRLYSNEKINVNRASTRFITSSDYLALNNLRLGYNLPRAVSEKIGISGLNIWLSGDNLFLLSKREGYNPTVSATALSGRYTYNPITSYTLGVRVKL